MHFGDTFTKYFDIIEINSQANRDDLLSKAYQLRYQVYAIERKIPDFEASNYPNQEEHDEYDKHSIQAILLHKQSGDVVGTVRLVCLNKSNPRSEFPLEKYLLPEHGFVIPDDIRHQSAEISRFILSSRFRSRKGENTSSDGLAEVHQILTSENDKRRSSPHPILGLIKAMVTLSWKHGINYWCAGMEPRLHKILSQLGIQFNEFSPFEYHHLPLTIYFRNVSEIMRDCYIQNQEVWRFLTDNGDSWPMEAEWHNSHIGQFPTKPK